VIILTSNKRTQTLKKRRYVDFDLKDPKHDDEGMKSTWVEELKIALSSEFLNTIDEVIVNYSLEKDHLSEIVTLVVKELVERLEEQEIAVEITDAAKDRITDEGYDPDYGARPLRRAIQKHVEDRLSEALLKGTVLTGGKVVVDVEDGELVVKTEEVVTK